MTYIPRIDSGVNKIEANESYCIEDNRQSVNYGGITILGEIIIYGDLILK